MLGAIIGDIAGSIYEFDNIKTKNFPLFSPGCYFTDDTVMSVAVAECLLNNDHDYAGAFRLWGRKYPDAGYGGMFDGWLRSDSMSAYDSWGNGSAMRVGPVGFAFDTIDEVMAEAERTARVTHDHPEGVKGAQATAAAIFMARQRIPKEELSQFIAARFGYDLNRTLDAIRPNYEFNESCAGTVPEAIIAFLEATGFEDAIRNAVSLGGDSDTLACITGGIAEAYYGIPSEIAEQAMNFLDEPIAKVVMEFRRRFNVEIAAASVRGDGQSTNLLEESL